MLKLYKTMETFGQISSYSVQLHAHVVYMNVEKIGLVRPVYIL